MLGSISEKIATNTYTEVANYTPFMLQKEMEKLNKSQPELFYFVLSSLEEADDSVREIGIYMFFVIYQMFKKAYGRIKKVTFNDIDEAYDKNFKVLETLEHGDENAIHNFAEEEMAKQPYVMRYITEALMEEDEYEDVQLTEEDKGFLFIFLKTITDILDKNTTKTIKVNK